MARADTNEPADRFRILRHDVKRATHEAVQTPDPNTILAVLGVATVVVGAATALWVELRARRIERRYPARGRTIQVDGVRLHHVERGHDPAVVLIHGNAVTPDDMDASGLIDGLAIDHRVIAFDRPGFGHRRRSRDRLWTPTAQARLLHEAMRSLGVERAVVVGTRWAPWSRPASRSTSPTS